MEGGSTLASSNNNDTTNTSSEWKSEELSKMETLVGLKIFGCSSTPLDEVKRLRLELKKLDQKIKIAEEETIDIQSRKLNGPIKICYERYDDPFTLINGSINIEAIDEEYCLADVMPGCVLELISCTPKERIEQEIKGIFVPFAKKDKNKKNWIDLYTYDVAYKPIKSWYVIAFQDEKQRLADLKATKDRMMTHQNACNDVERKTEGCSCLSGNPCSEGNKYNCKNWAGRFQVAKENGWKEF